MILVAKIKSCGEVGEEVGESTGIDGSACIAHQLLIKRDIVDGQKRVSQHFVGFDEMPKVCPAEVPARITLTILVKWILVKRVRCGADFNLPLPRKRLPVSGIARWYDTIEHIDTECDGLQNIKRIADTHQISGFILWQMRDSGLQHR